MEICEKGAAFVEEGGDLVFSHTKLILREGHQYSYAISPKHFTSISDIDIHTLELHPIPISQIFPSFSTEFTRAPDPPSSKLFVKRPSLLDYGDTPASTSQSTLILNEARICEILRRYPHPNVAEYLGCLVEDGKITGLCYVRYRGTLSERVRAGHLLERESCLKSIEDGIRHIHSLGLVHCDINPTNILMDGDIPRIGDFDSCHEEGSKLGLKAGTKGWTNDEFIIASCENDWYGLSKIREFLYKAKAY